jgi:hypothetical protein
MNYKATLVHTPPPPPPPAPPPEVVLRLTLKEARMIHYLTGRASGANVLAGPVYRALQDIPEVSRYKDRWANRLDREAKGIKFLRDDFEDVTP